MFILILFIKFKTKASVAHFWNFWMVFGKLSIAKLNMTTGTLLGWPYSFIITRPFDLVHSSLHIVIIYIRAVITDNGKLLYWFIASSGKCFNNAHSIICSASVSPILLMFQDQIFIDSRLVKILQHFMLFYFC